MGNPITWQNVNSPDGRLVSQLLAGAQQGITGGFDKLGDIITQREAVNQGAADRARDAAGQEFMNQLYGYKNPAELQAARESGVLAQQLAGLDPRNQAAARAALDARLGTLQGQTTANDAFAVNQVKQPMVMANAAADVANAPITRELARNSLLSRQAVEPVTQATALITANNDQGAAKLKQELRPLTDANARTEATIRGTQLSVEGTSAVQQRQDQIIAAETAKAAQRYQDQQLAGRLKLAPFATKLGLPLDASGAPDWNNMTTGERLKLDDAAIRAGVTTSTSAPLFSGDTGVANKFLAGLRQTPGVTPEAISRNQAKITGAFNTVTTGAPVGNDALAIDRAYANQKVVMDEASKRNRFAPGSPDAVTAYEQLAKDIEEHPSFKDSPEDMKYVQRLLGNISAHGLLVGDVRITPSVQDVMSAVRGTQEGKFFNHARAESIKEALIKSLSKSDTTGMLQQAEDIRMFQRQEARRAILNPVTPAQLPLNPLGLPPLEPKKR